jgi:hypothetical protein
MIPSMIGALGGSPWTPTLLFSSGETGIWVGAAYLSTMKQLSTGSTDVTTTGNPVGYWQDKSPNGINVIQATSANRPTYSSASPAVVFDGSNDNLASTTPLPSTTGSLCIRFKTGSTPFYDGDRVLVSCADTGTANNWFEVGVDSVGRIYLESNAGGTKHKAVGSTYLNLSTAYTVVAVHDGTDWYVELDGVEENPLILVSGGTFAWFGDVTGADNTVIGGTITSAGLVRPWKGEISEVIVTSQDLTA